ncbi:fimbrial protein [Aeromonas veronii]|uniref:fimbrial protein n=1 Tax=Aeromonas veronii TaxID=654 RepID=UPI002B466B26|nr:fimbrial protein [Aeromonas veronii]
MLRLGCLGLLIFPLWVNAAADDLELLGGELNLHGRIIDQPCVVSPESLDQEVEMGVVDVKELYANGVAELVPFSIRLTNCKPGIFRMAKVTFTGSQDTELSGGLAFTAGIAKGAGIRLYDVAQSPLNLGSTSRGYLLGGAADNELQFFARVEGYPAALTAKNIQPGDYSAVANFIVAYE